MTEFSERDLNRPWSANELAHLSERDLTNLAFWRALKNAAFFCPVAVVVALMGAGLGLAGKIIGWVVLVGFVLFALEPLVALATGAIALVVVAARKNPDEHSDLLWHLLQLLIALANVALYCGLAFWVYTRMNI